MVCVGFGYVLVMGMSRGWVNVQGELKGLKGMGGYSPPRTWDLDNWYYSPPLNIEYNRI